MNNVIPFPLKRKPNPKVGYCDYCKKEFNRTWGSFSFSCKDGVHGPISLLDEIKLEELDEPHSLR